MGLGRIAIRAGIGLSLIVAAGHLLQLLRTVILARLLEPSEFGLMGIAFVAITAAEVLSQTGFSRAVVQRRDDPTPYLDTIWLVSLARGLLLAGIVSAAAPLLGSFFRAPASVNVLRVVSLRFVLSGLFSPAWHLLERDLKLTRYAMPSLVCFVVDFLVTLAIALRHPSVWAMVWGYLAGVLAMGVATYVVGPYLPRARFDASRARSLYAFGRHIFRYELLSYILQQADRIVIGRLRSLTDLGLYTFASRLVTEPALSLHAIVMRVVFPTFASIQTERDRIREAYLRVMGLIALASIPPSVGLLAIAPEMIPVVLGERWVPMTGAFRILTFLGIATALERTCATVTAGIGHPHLATRASLVRLALVTLFLVPATLAFSIEGAAMVMVGAALPSTVYLLHAAGAAVGADQRDQWVVLGVPAIGSLAMLASVSTARVLLRDLSPAMMLPILIAVGSLVFLLSTLLVDRTNGSRLLSSVRHVLRLR